MSKLKSNELGPKMNGYHQQNHHNDLNNNSSNSNNSEANGGLHLDEHLDRSVLHQLEFYFSRENLLHDKYLLSQMDSDNYVPISILIQFNKIKKLFGNSNMSSSSDQERILFIQEIVKLNPNSKLQLDPNGIKLRANHKRCVVILREINKETPVESIMNIFEKCQVKCLNCEFAGSRSWYLTFKDEQEAQIAVQFIKEEAQTFNNEPLFARIKTNPIPRVNSSSNPIQVNSPPNAEQDKVEMEPDSSKNYGYSMYPAAYYYPPEFHSLMANPWMFYPSTPNQFYPNFSKMKQTSIIDNNNPSSNNMSSASNYMVSPLDPLMFSYGPYPAYKRKNKSKAETDTNSSQNEDNEDQDKRNYYRRYNIGTYNQNFIILPNPATFGYASGPPVSHIPYNVGMYPSSFAQSAPQVINQPSSSSSSTSSRPSNQVDTSNQKNNQLKTNRYNNGKKYANQSSRPTIEYDATKEKRLNNYSKYSKLNGKTGNANFKKSGRPSSRKDDSPIQFDYEPTSFPPLNDKNEENIDIEPPVESSEDLINEIVEMPTDSNSPWSRKSFAEIVKIPTNTLSQEIEKLAISED